MEVEGNSKNAKEINFAIKLEALKKKAKSQGFFVTKDQIEETFAAMDFTKEQLGLVIDYLDKHKIGVGEPVDAEEHLTEVEFDYLQQYLQELDALPKYSSGEREAITLNAMAGDRDAQLKLTEIYLPNVAEIAKLYTGQGVLIEDLIGEGNVAATLGVTMLGCLEDASEAEGMMGKLIMDAMESFIGELYTNRQVDKQAELLVNQVAESARLLAEEVQRKITAAELAAEIDLSKEVIEEAIRISGEAIDYLEN